MEHHIVKIQSIKNVTHDVLQIITERPVDYNFTPGQATRLLSIRKNGKKKKDLLHLRACLMQNFLSSPSKHIHHETELQTNYQN